jgi:hypothetical protein
VPAGLWSSGASLPDPRSQTRALAFDGALWLIGGYPPAPQLPSPIVFRFDGVSWSEAGTLPIGIAYHGLVEFAGKMWTIGGIDSGDVRGRCFSSPDGAVWTEEAPLPVDVFGSVCVALGDGIYSIGGVLPDDSVSQKVYKTLDGTSWAEVGSDAFPEKLYLTQGMIFNGAMYVVGGFLGDGGADGFSPDVWRSADGETWAIVGAMPEGLGFFSAAAAQGYLWVFGGFGTQDTDWTRDIWSSPDGITWSASEPLPEFIAEAGAADYAGALWVVGGFNVPDDHPLDTAYTFTLTAPVPPVPSTGGAESRLSIGPRPIFGSGSAEYGVLLALGRGSVQYPETFGRGLSSGVLKASGSGRLILPVSGSGGVAVHLEALGAGLLMRREIPVPQAPIPADPVAAAERRKRRKPEALPAVDIHEEMIIMRELLK